MSLPTQTAEAKRLVLKQLFDGTQAFPIIGAFDAMCAKLVQSHDIPCTYVSGSATATSRMGYADVGLTPLSDAVSEAGLISQAVDIPTIADADTGFGSVADCVQAFESAGVSAIHLEDQVFPKRCGHLEGKEVIPEQEMVALIKEACLARKDKNFLIIGRVDSLSVHGFDDMLHRAQAYCDAGADVIFPEALTSLSEYETVCKTLPKPVLANMTEFGKTPFKTVSEFSGVGVRAVLFPLSVYRVIMKSMDQAIQAIKENGNQATLTDHMMSRSDFYDFIDYKSFEKLAEQQSDA